MKVPFVDLVAQYQSIQAEIDQAIHSVLEHGEFVSGPFVAAFEQHFAAMHGMKYCAGVSSGTSALHVALWGLGISAGDEVIVPTNTFIATAATVSLTGARPVFVDCEAEYFNINPDLIETAITNKTRAIIAVHLFGQPAQMDSIKKIAEKHDLLLIEDCAQAHFACFKGQPVGTFGECGCFSFYPSKNLGAYGEGGAVLTNDPQLYEKMLMLREHGSKQKYHHQIIGHNYRLHGMQGAILDVKLKHIDLWTEQRRQNAGLYRQYLQDCDAIQLPKEMPECWHVYHLFVIRTKLRDELMAFLKKHDIATGIHYPIPCHLQECFNQLDVSKKGFPVAEQCAQDMVSLPMYPELTEEQIRFTCSKIQEFACTQSKIAAS